MRSIITKQKNRQNGKGVIEYILLLAAVIAFLLIFLSKGGYFHRSYNKVLGMQGNDILDAAHDIFNPRGN